MEKADEGAPKGRVPCVLCEGERNLRLGAEARCELLERERREHIRFLAEHNFGAFDVLRRNAETYRRQYSQALVRAEAAEAKLAAGQAKEGR